MNPMQGMKMNERYRTYLRYGAESEDLRILQPLHVHQRVARVAERVSNHRIKALHCRTLIGRILEVLQVRSGKRMPTNETQCSVEGCRLQAVGSRL